MILNDQGGLYMNISDDVSGALRAQEHGHQPVVYGISAYDSNAMKSDNPNSGIYEAETSRTLDLNGGSPACNQGGMAVVCLEGNGSRPSHQGDGWHEGDPMYTLNSTEHHAVAIENHPADSRVKVSENGIVQTLSGRMETSGGNVPMVMEPVCVGNGQLAQARLSPTVGTLNCMHDQQAVMTYGLDRASFNQGENAKYDFQIDEEKIGCQVARGPGAVCKTYQDVTETVCARISAGTSNQLAQDDMFVANTSVVRRLTPLECTRLQGFPDGWVDIGEWVDSKGKVRKEADAPKYKALGNSIALPFWKWLAKRIREQYSGDDITMASLFDGICGFPLVFLYVGITPVWCSEIEDFPIAVAKKHFPDTD